MLSFVIGQEVTTTDKTGTDRKENDWSKVTKTFELSKFARKRGKVGREIVLNPRSRGIKIVKRPC